MYDITTTTTPIESGGETETSPPLSVDDLLSIEARLLSIEARLSWLIGALAAIGSLFKPLRKAMEDLPAPPR